LVKFLHTGDWQIGETFQFLGERSLYLKDARVSAIERIAELAVREAVDFVVVAGDVFEFSRPDRVSLRRLVDAMRPYPGPWLLLPGNHDPATPHGLWDQIRERSIFGSEVVFMTTTTPIVLERSKTVVLPAPLQARYAGRDLTEGFDTEISPPGYYRIGVAHGAVMGILPEAAEANNPIAADRAERGRLDYLALGDWHGFYRVNERTYYAGTPETDRFRANDSGSVAIVTIAQPGATPVVTQHRIGEYTWHERSFSVGSQLDLAGLEGELATFGAKDVVKVTLTGYVDLEGVGVLNRLAEELRARVLVLDWDGDGVEVVPADGELASLALQGVGGLILERLFAMRSKLEAGVFRRAVVELLSLDEEG
jgi:DNA repair exonuclease SbcCD nuclease subunit